MGRQEGLTELGRYRLVGRATNLEELALAIRACAVGGYISGMTRNFKAVTMAKWCLEFENLPDNYLTRNYGIRQQAIYLTLKTKKR